MGFLKERLQKVVIGGISKKIAGGVAGVAVLDGHPYAQAIVIAVTILAQAYVDAKK